MLIRNAEVIVEQAAELNTLFSLCFNGLAFSPNRSAVLHAVNENSPIRCHAAITIRTIPLAGQPVECALLGLVCVHPDVRGSHAGYAVIQELHAAVDLPFVLNCGAGLVPYYTRLGYTIISQRASYDRNGVVEIDDDPVLMFSNGHGKLPLFGEGPIHLGTDF